MNHLVSLLLLAASSQALPAPEPQIGFGHPLLYHAPNCTTEEDTITTKACKPVTENVCEDIEIPGSKIEYEDNCSVSIPPPPPLERFPACSPCLGAHGPAVRPPACRAGGGG